MMDLWTRGVAGIMVRVVLVLSSSLRAGGEGERSRALLRTDGANARWFSLIA